MFSKLVCFVLIPHTLELFHTDSDKINKRKKYAPQNGLNVYCRCKSMVAKLQLAPRSKKKSGHRNKFKLLAPSIIVYFIFMKKLPLKRHMVLREIVEFVSKASHSPLR